MYRLVGVGIFVLIVVGGLSLVSRYMLAKAVINGDYSNVITGAVNASGVHEIQSPYRKHELSTGQ